MENTGTITTGISFDVPTLKDADEIAGQLKISRSRFVQIAVRNQIKTYRKQTVREYLDSLSEKELDTLKEIIKKGA